MVGERLEGAIWGWCMVNREECNGVIVGWCNSGGAIERGDWLEGLTFNEVEKLTSWKSSSKARKGSLRGGFVGVAIGLGYQGDCRW